VAAIDREFKDKSSPSLTLPLDANKTVCTEETVNHFDVCLVLAKMSV
jgi:hypothetical protein